MTTKSFFQQKTWTEKSRMIRLLFISSTGPFTTDISACAFSVTSILSDSLWPHGLQTTRLLCPWESPGKNTELGCHFLLQGIFLTQGSNSCLLHWQMDSLLLCHRGRRIQNLKANSPRSVEYCSWSLKVVWRQNSSLHGDIPYMGNSVTSWLSSIKHLHTEALGTQG